MAKPDQASVPKDERRWRVRHKQAKIIADPVWACGISGCALERKKNRASQDGAQRHRAPELRLASSKLRGRGKKSADGAPVEGTSTGKVLASPVGCWLLGLFGVAWLECR